MRPSREGPCSRRRHTPYAGPSPGSLQRPARHAFGGESSGRFLYNARKPAAAHQPMIRMHAAGGCSSNLITGSVHMQKIVGGVVLALVLSWVAAAPAASVTQ